MEYISGTEIKKPVCINDIKELPEECLINIHGSLHTIRDMADTSFLILRTPEGVIQCVADEKGTIKPEEIKKIPLESSIAVSGEKHSDERAPFGFELKIKGITVISEPEKEKQPVNIAKYSLKASMETKLTLRTFTLRNLRERAVFKIEEGIVKGFTDYMYSEGFTQIHTPKIVSGNAEGGANVFKLDYFNKPAFLAQSPQFYKQIMVGVFERVFEVGPVFRAEKHNTVRHLNEYTGLDFEMGFINSFTEIMQTEAGALDFIVKLLKKEYQHEIEILKITLPETGKIPYVRFSDAKKLVEEKYGRKIRDPFDLEPEEETLIGRYFKEECNADFVFVTHYPSKKRPFYAMDDPDDNKYTLSFDLLLDGIEVTTGGQRIHDYGKLKEKMIKRGMNPDEFTDYLSCFKYGMPPHGGLGIGLERLAMKICGLTNIREASLFPRDVNRLTP